MPIRTSLKSRTASRNDSEAEDSSTSNHAVVASLPDRSPDPFSSLALSPDRNHAIVASKDTLQLIKIDPSGLRTIRSIKIGHHFNVTDPSTSIAKPGNAQRRYGDVRDAFQLGTSTSAPRGASMTQIVNISITKVAWSHAMDFGNTMTTTPGTSGTIAEKMASSLHHQEERNTKSSEGKDSFVAVAASNGVVVIWNAIRLLFSDPAKAPTTARGQGRAGSAFTNTQFRQQPEGVISQHVRAVNSLSWHPKRAGLLLTASQDGSVKLWERFLVGLRKPDGSKQPRRPWYAVGGRGMDRGTGSGDGDEAAPTRTYSWKFKAGFEPKSEAVRDIQWSPYLDDIFGLVTASGYLIVYSMHVSVKAMIKIAAHTGDATSLDWHPTRPFDLATGGSGDRTVKVWDLQSALDMSAKDVQDHSSISANSNTWKSEVSTNSQSSSETDKSIASSSYGPGYNTMRSTSGISSAGRGKGSSSTFSRYVLSISASVTQVRWRPPSIEPLGVKISGDSDGDEVEDEVDPHESMLAVATARLTSAGGSGVLSMWTFHRPFMALSVVEGHIEGAVADFVWLQSPVRIRRPNGNGSNQRPTPTGGAKKVVSDYKLHKASQNVSDAALFRPGGRGRERSPSEIDDDSTGGDGETKDSSRYLSVWQHVLSVGRDGRCILQSFTRGDRPISRVASSCFAMANLSPFQQGYGSLQCFSAYQAVPNSPEDDFALTFLRQDRYTADAPGVFREDDVQQGNLPESFKNFAGQRLPSTVPELVFSVVDQGDLDDNGLPINQATDMVCVAPEVVHLSRFASSYKLYPDVECPRRVDLCFHNCSVADDLKFGPVARMWATVARLLKSAGMDELPSLSSEKPSNVFQLVMLPTIKNLLLERAEAGDVQTCVALCEVLQVIQAGGKVRVPGIGISLVREWYLAYIDLLHQMCLFSAAAFLIKNCVDEVISALNQQSTTIHQSCPRCGKPLQHTTDASSGSDGSKQVTSSARQACKNCRRRVGMCFLCHQPVQGMFVWCPGCGHGGHLEHALQWFGGGQGGKAVREVCPTGCGHRCNFMHMVTAFPRTDSFLGLPLPPTTTDFPIGSTADTPRVTT